MRFSAISRNAFRTIPCRNASVVAPNKMKFMKSPGSTENQGNNTIEPLLHPIKRDIEMIPLSVESAKQPNTIFKLPSDIPMMPQALSESLNALSAKGLMMRKLVVQILKKIDEAGHGVFVLDGRRGVGKSSALLQLVGLTKSREHSPFILYIPNMARTTAGYYPYYVNSASGAFDQPELAQELITAFATLNAASLEGNAELKKLCQDAKGNLKGAVDAFNRLIDALKGCKVLLAVDQADALFCATQYRDQASNPIGVDELSVLSTLKRFALTPNPNLTFIGATCKSDPFFRRPSSELSMLNKIQIEPFTVAEVQALLKFYNSIGHSFKNASLNYSQLIHFVSGGIPENLVKVCNYESIYTP